MAGLTVKQTAEQLGVSTAHVYWLINHKKLRLLKSGFVSEKSVEKHIKNPLKRGRPFGTFK